MLINSSQKAFACLEKAIANDVEEFWVLALNSSLTLLEKKLLFRGTANSCLVHPRDLIKFVCAQNATSFVIAHNHPSGDPRPSTYDVEITKKFFHLSRLIEIPMNDHLILGKNSYYSFADKGQLAKLRTLKLLRLHP